MTVDRTWDGRAVPQVEAATVSVRCDDRGLLLEIDAPYWDDPRPDGPPGSFDGLWEHEVVEVFVLGTGDGEQYTEVEVGPHGHHLVLRLEGPRNVVGSGLPLDVTAAISPDGTRWTARALLAPDHLPPPPHRFNAYAIHGVGAQRRYLAWIPTGGTSPDFHRLEVFGQLPEGTRIRP